MKNLENNYEYTCVSTVREYIAAMKDSPGPPEGAKNFSKS